MGGAGPPRSTFAAGRKWISGPSTWAWGRAEALRPAQWTCADAGLVRRPLRWRDRRRSDQSPAWAAGVWAARRQAQAMWAAPWSWAPAPWWTWLRLRAFAERSISGRRMAVVARRRGLSPRGLALAWVASGLQLSESAASAGRESEAPAGFRTRAIGAAAVVAERLAAHCFGFSRNRARSDRFPSGCAAVR